MKRITVAKFTLIAIVVFTVLFIVVGLLVSTVKHTTMTDGVSVQDSMIFEYLASLATVIDLPEEEPMTGDSVCAYVSHDTVYIQHYHGYEHQSKMFKFIYNQ